MIRILVFLAGSCAFAQTSPELKLILDRLDKLEAQNRELLTEVRELRGKLGPTEAPVVERQEAQENRIAQVDQE